MGRLVAPSGHAIVGTLDRIPGIAKINGASRNGETGEYDLDWEGHTEVLWNDQVTIYRQKERVFVDEDGGEWLESDLKLVSPFQITLVANDIQVTADNENDAKRHAYADASDFKLGWNVRCDDTEELDFDQGETEVDIEVELDEQADDLWTFTATYVVSLEAESLEHAVTKAVAEIHGKLIEESTDVVDGEQPSADEEEA